MTTTKREPVPRVPPMSSSSRNTSHTRGEFPFTEIPKSGPLPKPDNTHHKEKVTMANSTTKLKNLIVNNQDVIKRKVLVGVGAAVGLLIASSIAERIGKPRVTNITIINNEPLDDIAEPDSAPLEP